MKASARVRSMRRKVVLWLVSSSERWEKELAVMTQGIADGLKKSVRGCN